MENPDEDVLINDEMYYRTISHQVIILHTAITSHTQLRKIILENHIVPNMAEFLFIFRVLIE